MSLSRVRLIALSICIVGISLGFDGPVGAAKTLNNGGKQAQAARCGRCGDGQCVRQCGETATSCPADCGVGSTGVK
jgi:hypothetical protein